MALAPADNTEMAMRMKKRKMIWVLVILSILDLLRGVWRQLFKNMSSRKIYSQTIFKRIGLPEDLFSN